MQSLRNSWEAHAVTSCGRRATGAGFSRLDDGESGGRLNHAYSYVASRPEPFRSLRTPLRTRGTARQDGNRMRAARAGPTYNQIGWQIGWQDEQGSRHTLAHAHRESQCPHPRPESTRPATSTMKSYGLETALRDRAFILNTSILCTKKTRFYAYLPLHHPLHKVNVLIPPCMYRFHKLSAPRGRICPGGPARNIASSVRLGLRTEPGRRS